MDRDALTDADGAPMLTKRQVALLLGVDVSTVKRLDPAALPFIRIVRRGDRRYLARDVQRYLAERRVES